MRRGNGAGHQQHSMVNELPGPVAAALKAAVGAEGYVDDPAILAPHLAEWRGLFRGAAPVLVAPGSAAEAARVIGLCAAARVGVVPQGGNTGLVGGAIPHSRPGHPEIILSAARLNRIRELDAANYTVVAESGVILAALQAAATAAGRLFPLSLAAEGSCQLGGVVSTNAGGTAVIRYGTTRDLVLGLEVVLPDGSVLDRLRVLRKDNTGYDLRQLFIGAEGTLGFITAVSCKLFPAPRTSGTAWVAVPTPAAAIGLLAAARERLGDEVTAFELMSRLAVDLVVRHIAGARDPLPGAGPWYVLLELASSREGAHPEADLEAFLGWASDRGLATDAAVAASGAQQAAFWRVRHAMSGAQKHAGASIKHDVSVPVSRIDAFLEQAGAYVAGRIPGVRVVAFGHVGDGNLHYNLSQPEALAAADFLALWGEVSAGVHDIAVGLGGSFSAEHGIGSLKVGELQRWRGGTEYRLMQALKATIDPLGIMNPGKVVTGPA
jgi:FAD/FMN-containing dehydrogenase